VSDATIIMELFELELQSEAQWRELPGFDLIADQEATHARGLERALAGMGRRPPKRRFLHVRDSLADALTLEDELVRAYSEAMATISNVRLLAPLASIGANHGQHLVILRRELGRRPFTRAFEPVE
jgi:Ferritin-like domain